MSKVTIEDIEVEIIKKDIKNLHLYVLPPKGEVRVSAPKRLREEEIRTFISNKISWIKKQQLKLINKPRQPRNEYVSGETIYLWGVEYYLVVYYIKGISKIEINGSELKLYVKEESSIRQREKVILQWYRKELKNAISPLLYKWQSIIGVEANSWNVKNMRTRWGTCNVKARRIWLSLQLAKKKPICLEYVIAHELVHLLEKNHNSTFYAYMDKFLPNWRTIKCKLNA